MDILAEKMNLPLISTLQMTSQTFFNLRTLLNIRFLYGLNKTVHHNGPIDNFGFYTYIDASNHLSETYFELQQMFTERFDYQTLYFIHFNWPKIDINHTKHEDLIVIKWVYIKFDANIETSSYFETDVNIS